MDCKASIAALLLGLSATACADDSQRVVATPPSEQLYLLWSGTSGDEVDSNYFTPLPSLDVGTVVDYGRALEQPGIARLYGQDGVGFFALGDGEEQSITRYELGADDAFVPGQKLSLQPFGVELLADATSLKFISPSKAYYIDPSGLQVLIW